MYTHEIKSQVNGIATVEFSNGETETYTEQVTVLDAQFATEETPFIPPVYEIVEHTRSKVIVATFPDDATLTDKITSKLNELNEVSSSGPTEEELAQRAFLTAKSEWLLKKQALATMIDDMERGSKLGIDPDAEQVAIMTELATWVNTNMRKEYYF